MKRGRRAVLSNVLIEALEMLVGDRRQRVLGTAERAAVVEVLAEQLVLVIEHPHGGVGQFVGTEDRRCSSAICTSAPAPVRVLSRSRPAARRRPRPPRPAGRCAGGQRNVAAAADGLVGTSTAVINCCPAWPPWRAPRPPPSRRRSAATRQRPARAPRRLPPEAARRDAWNRRDRRARRGDELRSLHTHGVSDVGSPPHLTSPSVFWGSDSIAALRATNAVLTVCRFAVRDPLIR